MNNTLRIKNKYGKWHTLEVSARNVGNRNPEAQLQFTITQYSDKTSKNTFFSIPPDKVEAFMEMLKDKKAIKL